LFRPFRDGIGPNYFLLINPLKKLPRKPPKDRTLSKNCEMNSHQALNLRQPEACTIFFIKGLRLATTLSVNFVVSPVKTMPL
jgi:hypothetical protein